MTEVEFRTATRLRTKQVLTWFSLAIGAIVAWFGIVLTLGLTGGLVVVPVVPLFLIPLTIAERKATEFSVPCPNCEEDLAKYSDAVLATRCCSICETMVLEDGRRRRKEVWARVQRIRQNRFVGDWLWAWPALFAFVATMSWSDPLCMRG